MSDKFIYKINKTSSILNSWYFLKVIMPSSSCSLYVLYNKFPELQVVCRIGFLPRPPPNTSSYKKFYQFFTMSRITCLELRETPGFRPFYS